jgi:hypothetical protein
LSIGWTFNPVFFSPDPGHVAASTAGSSTTPGLASHFDGRIDLRRVPEPIAPHFLPSLGIVMARIAKKILDTELSFLGESTR